MAKFLLFDAGDGAQRSMESQQLPIADIDAVFLTHFHSDHMADLGEVISRSWILGRQHLLPIYGGPAVDRVVQGYRSAYSPDVTYRNAHHASEVFPEPSLHAEAVQLEQAPATGVVIYEQGGVRVWAYGVDHSPVSPAVGYRIEYGGRAIGISGDTVDSDGLRDLASNADLLVSEVMDKTLVLDTACAFERLGDDRNELLFRDIRTYHTDLLELANTAAEGGIDTLMLTHMVPTTDATQAELLFGDPIRDVFSGEVIVASDDTWFTLDVDPQQETQGLSE